MKRTLVSLFACFLVFLLTTACGKNELKHKNQTIEKTGSANSDASQQIPLTSAAVNDETATDEMPRDNDSPLNILLQAKVGDRVQTGVRTNVPDDWYKFYEDDEAIYLLYGDYYEAAWLDAVALGEAGLVVKDAYTVATPNDRHNHVDELLGFMTDEHNWSRLQGAFSERYPFHNVSVTGGPTKEMMEEVGQNFSPNSPMLRPHTEVDGYGGCMGYWLATEDTRGSTTMYGVRCMVYLALIDSNRTENGYCFRPLVRVAKQERPMTAEELEEQAMRTAAEESGLSAGKLMSLHYADYNADGRAEAFALFASDVGDDVYSHEDVDIIYVNPEMECQLILQHGAGYDAVVEQAEQFSFLIWENDLGDGRAVSLVYGVNPASEPFSPDISGKCSSFHFDPVGVRFRAFLTIPNSGAVECTLNFIPETMEFTVDSGSLSAEGHCGDNLRWEIREGNGLIFYGSGAMWDYSADADNLAPWWYFRENITILCLYADLDSIGAYSFDCLTNLEEIWYDGSKEDWEKLTANLSEGNEILLGFQVHYGK